MTITVRERVEVAWRKWKKYYAVVLNVGVECSLQDIPQQDSSVRQQGDTIPQQGVCIPQQNTGVEGEPFVFKMVPSAPLSASMIRPSSVQPTPLNNLSSIMEKLESLADVVTGSEARMLCRFNAFEAKIAVLQHVTTVSTPLPT